MKNIIWSVQAESSYLDVLEQIFLDWNIEIVERLESQVNSLLNLLDKNLFLCPKSNFMELRKCVVNKHISLVYRIKDNQIELVTFLFNKSEHIF